MGTCRATAFTFYSKVQKYCTDCNADTNYLLLVIENYVFSQIQSSSSSRMRVIYHKFNDDSAIDCGHHFSEKFPPHGSRSMD